MTLKSFHILFITLAALTNFMFCFWTRTTPVEGVTPGLRMVGVLAALIGGGLCVYGVWFVKKSRNIIT